MPIDFRAALNDEQYDAVTAPAAPLLVLAGAGSGKTRTLTYRVAWLISRGVPPGEILLLTFTNKAANEMLHRVEELTGIGPRRFWGGTFHSLGNRALRLYGDQIGLARGFTILDADESETLLKRCVEDCDKTFFKNKTYPRPGPLFSILSLARNTQQSIATTVRKNFPQHSEIEHRLDDFAASYEKAKREQAVVDYDDLLELWLRLLSESQTVADYFAQRFRYLLVDEYQDTNTLQAQIVDKLAPHHCITAVGDDAQCIYSWRGADFENIMRFPDRHPDTAIHRIETNYRSTPDILAYANAVLQAQPLGRHFDKELRSARAPYQKPHLVETVDDREQAEFVLKRIRALIEDEGVSASEIAILYRSHFLALEMQLALARTGLPYQITSGVKFFERQHIRDLVALLRFIYNPTDTLAWQRIATLLPKVGEKGAQKIHAAARDHAVLLQSDFVAALATDDVLSKVPKDAREEWPHFCASLAEVAAELRDGRAPALAVEHAIEGWYGDYLRGAFADYAERLDELKALATFATRFDTVDDFLSQIVLLNGETADARSATDAEKPAAAIRLTTIHQAKGLEYDVVFLIGLADGQFPSRRAIDAGDIEEERRLFYVAVTRAKNELYLSYPKVASRPGPGGMMNTPSRFLLEVPDTLYERLRIKRRFDWRR
ncbi:DNA helicase UvrD [Cephaloticoccus primus]|uniref:DNA 3'-5' helicase n=1 Tax=Cephaloticoccus primus TaxID=1548207 RepID=A0A139SKT9_9BACT|nr:DNA helicase UvrD [Cephaloticoccus primus]